MIRLPRLLTCLLLVLPLLASAQTPLDYTILDHTRQLSFARHEIAGTQLRTPRKWQLSTFSGISGNYGFFNRTNAYSLSVPVGLQVTRPLNKNLYAFAAVSVAPAYMNFNSFFLQQQPGKFSSPLMMTGTNQFGWYSRAEAGLFYINDEKTFSISGSVHIDRTSYPIYSPFVPQPTRSFSR